MTFPHRERIFQERYDIPTQRNDIPREVPMTFPHREMIFQERDDIPTERDDIPRKG